MNSVHHQATTKKKNLTFTTKVNKVNKSELGPFPYFIVF